MAASTQRYAFLLVLTLVACITLPLHTRAYEPLSLKTEPGFVVPEIAQPAPDLSEYAASAVLSQLPKNLDGKVALQPTDGNRYLEEAFRRKRGIDLQQRQQTKDTQVLVIEQGVMTLSEVVDQINAPQYAESSQGIITLRLPLLVAPGATLVVDGNQTPELRLSTDRGAFIINAGKFFVAETKVLGWDEANEELSRFVDKKKFRPFLASLIRSQTYLIQSHFESLGFAEPTAYGISLSTQPERLHGTPTADAPTGVLVGNTFKDLYYGFYSYEARDVAILDNLYDQCIVYGIDPHDRSTRLTIARNTTINTEQKHGIIGSRGVSNSRIIDNISYGNAGSGIMLDRQCSNNLIARNQVYRNNQGIAIYESPNNLIVQNTVACNAKSAVRIRNSVGIRVQDNTLVRSGDYAFEIAAKRLTDHDQRVARGDHYSIGVEVELFDIRLDGNRGLAKATGLGLARMANFSTDVKIAQIEAQIGEKLESPEYVGEDKKLGGQLEPLAAEISPLFSEQGLLVTIQRTDQQKNPRQANKNP